MPGLVPGIHVFGTPIQVKGVDGRVKPGHDVEDLDTRVDHFAGFGPIRSPCFTRSGALCTSV
jgi:hypothetical protein